MKQTSPDKITPTAKFVAYLRTFAGIPYSEEIASMCGAKSAFQEILKEKLSEVLTDDSAICAVLAPIVEAHYRSVDFALNHFGFRKNDVLFYFLFFSLLYQKNI